MTYLPLIRFARVPLFAGLTLVLTTQFAFADSGQGNLADIAEKLLPTVVSIEATQRSIDSNGNDPNELLKQFSDHQNPGNNGTGTEPSEATLQGSGFIIDPAGYVVTNNRIIEGAQKITVRAENSTEYKAKVIGHDPRTDLALLKISAPRPLPAAEWGDSDRARVGDRVLAIGNPFGFGGTVTAGIISARQHVTAVGLYDDLIQTDATINRGNSGGPMFDMDGKVIGINAAIFSLSGDSIRIGFALPSSLAKDIVAQLRRYGHPRRSWLGIRVQNVTPDLAEAFKLPKPMGALVTVVTTGSPAERGGIKRGDVVMRFDNQEVTEMRYFPRIVVQTPFNRSVPVIVMRRGQQLRLRVRLRELHETETKSRGPSGISSEPERSPD
jgi:serine protease Do